MNNTTQHLFEALIKNKSFKQYILNEMSSEESESISLFSENNLYRWCVKEHGTLSDNIQWTELTFQLLGYKYPDLWNTPLSKQTTMVNSILENQFKQQFMSCKTNASKDKHLYFNEYRIRKFLQNHHLNTSDICYNHLVYYHYKQMAEHKQSEANNTYVGVKFSGSNKMYFYKAGKYIVQENDFVTVNNAGVIKKVKVLRIETDHKPRQLINYKTILSVETTKPNLWARPTNKNLAEREHRLWSSKGFQFQQDIMNSLMLNIPKISGTKAELLVIDDIHDETVINIPKSHMADAYAYVADKIFKNTGLSLINLPKQKEKTMDNQANKVAQKEMIDTEIHTYTDKQYEKRTFYNGYDLTFSSDNHVIDIILNLQTKVSRLKKLARRLNSDKIRKQFQHAKDDLKFLKDFFETR